jgi:hypothetical protein
MRRLPRTEGGRGGSTFPGIVPDATRFASARSNERLRPATRRCFARLDGGTSDDAHSSNSLLTKKPMVNWLGR